MFQKLTTSFSRHRTLLLPFLILAGLLVIIGHVRLDAAPVYTYTTGMWSDTFTDNTGLSAKTNVDVNAGALQLTNSGGTFTAPYNTEGSATSTVIDPIPWNQDYVNPTSIAHFNTLDINATIPTGTTATVQLLNADRLVIDNSVIAGNSTGINLTNGTTTVDISAYNSGPPQSGAKIFFLYLKTHLATTDTNQTPTINRWQVTWTTRQGDLSATTLASSAWPATGHDMQGTYRSQYNGPEYPTFKYFKSLPGILYNSRSSAIIDSLNHYIISTDLLSYTSLDKDTGATIWSGPKMYGYYGSNFWGITGITASASGNLYNTDEFNDFASIVDAATGVFNLAKRTNTGHMFGAPVMTTSGNVLWLEYSGYNPLGTPVTLVSAGSDLSKNWGTNCSLASSNSGFFNFTNLALSPDQSKVYFSYFHTTGAASADFLSDSAVYAYNTVDGSLAWSYTTKPNVEGRIFVGPDGTVYDGGSYYSAFGTTYPPPSYPTVYAINPDGTLKWSYTFSGTDYFIDMQALGLDRIEGLVSDGRTYNHAFALSLADGSLLWEKNVNFYTLSGTNYVAYSYSIMDGANSFYYLPNAWDSAHGPVAYQKLDANGNIKWSITYPSSATSGVDTSFGSVIDENGTLIIPDGAYSQNASGVAAYTNWTLSSTDLSTTTFNTGDTIHFEAISNMPQTNPITGGANQAQIYLSNGDIVALTYSSTDSSGDTHWTGSYVVPSSFTSGSYTYTIEAAQDNISTDISTHFSSAPTGSGNTGLTATGTFLVHQVMGGYSFCQTSWSGGPGQLNWLTSSPNKYYAQGGSGVYDTATSTQISMKVSASSELGQPDMTTNTANNGMINIAANTMYSPYAAQVKNGKMIIDDDANNRVLIYNTIPTANNAQADVVIGQPDFNHNFPNQGTNMSTPGPVGPNTLYNPMGAYYDGTRLFIADEENNRILIYNSLPTTNNAPADVVVGQSSFYTNTPPSVIGGSTLRYPSDVYSDGTKLYVADSGDSRVLIYNTIPTSNGASADVAVGAPSLTSWPGTVGPATVYSPRGVYSDGTKLYIADSYFNRVLIYNTIPTTSGASADVVVGQVDFTHSSSNQGGAVGPNTLSYPTKVYSDGTKLYIADTSNQRVLIYNSIPTINGASADVVVGQADFTHNSSNQNGTASAATLGNPESVYSDGTKLFIADAGNNRVLIYNNIPNVNNVSADVVVGQEKFTLSTSNQGGFTTANTLYGVAGSMVINGKLVVVDANNNRVLIYNSIPTTNNVSADVVIGQIDFSHHDPNQGNSTPAANTLYGPEGVASDGTRLFIADTYNSRILIYNTVPIANNASADLVVGQAGFVTRSGGTTSSTLSLPFDVAYSNSKLFIADTFNNRVLIYNSVPTSNGAAADVVVGQPNFTSNTQNQGGYGTTPLANTLYEPFGVASDGARLFISDTSNNRVLIYNTIPTTNDASADLEIGQVDFNHCNANQGPDGRSVCNYFYRPAIPLYANTLGHPMGIFWDGARLLIADNYNGRVLVFDSIPTTNNASASSVIGTPDLTSYAVYTVPDGSVVSPASVYVQGNTLYVASGNRLLMFPLGAPQEATLTSSIYSGGVGYSIWGPFSVDSTVPDNSSVSLEVSTDNGTTWKPVVNFTDQTFGPAQTLQYRVDFKNTDGIAKPVVRSVCFKYALFNATTSGGGSGISSILPSPTPAPSVSPVSSPTTPNPPQPTPSQSIVPLPQSTPAVSVSPSPSINLSLPKANLIPSSCVFTKNLYSGISDPQVHCLQILLNTNGYPLAVRGAGSLNSETNYFGPLTQAALKRFQQAHQINPALGYFGPITRGFILSLTK